MRARLARNGVDWTLRRSGDESQHLKAVPGEDALGWRELGFAPVAINRRAISTAFDFDAGEHVAHRRRQRRMRKNDARIGEETAPIAGMMAALAQIDDELDWMAAARRRPIGCGARAVRCNEQVGTQEVMLLRDAKLAQAGRAHFLSHFDENFRVEAEPAALGQDRRERGDVDAVLPLVICSTATVQALTFDREHPRRQSRAPQIIEAAHCVAVPVDQQRERGALLLALGHQKWRTRWIVQNARGEAERGSASSRPRDSAAARERVPVPGCY